MSDLSTLHQRIIEFRRDLQVTLPKRIAEDMYRETMQNFDQEAYTNDGGSDDWADRPYESQLGYKKLQYTGRLKRSIKPMGKRIAGGGVAQLGTNVPYARVHNEGGITDKSKKAMRTLSNGKKVNIASGRIWKRQFMGIGSETVDKARSEIDRVCSSYFARF